MKLKTINLLGVHISQISLSEVMSRFIQAIQENSRLVIQYANIHSINLAYELDWFRDFYNLADIVFCDGVGVQLGVRLLGKSLPERFTPPDWFPDLCELCVENNFSMFLLGTYPGITEEVAQLYQARYPGLRIAGTHHGYFNKEKEHPENQAVLEKINQAAPDILVFGFGMPIQEKWLSENLDQLNASVYLAVGAMFDFLAGKTYRGPKWMTDNGLEWLSRLFTEPKRLWKRYLIGNPLFFWRVLKQRFGTNKEA